MIGANFRLTKIFGDSVIWGDEIFQAIKEGGYFIFGGQTLNDYRIVVEV